jgi:hypothetical protein
MTSDDLKALAKFLKEQADAESVETANIPVSIQGIGNINVQVSSEITDKRRDFARTLEALRYRPFMMRGVCTEIGIDPEPLCGPLGKVPLLLAFCHKDPLTTAICKWRLENNI